jgi:hypothetical protein
MACQNVRQIERFFTDHQNNLGQAGDNRWREFADCLMRLRYAERIRVIEQYGQRHTPNSPSLHFVRAWGDLIHRKIDAGHWPNLRDEIAWQSYGEGHIRQFASDQHSNQRHAPLENALTQYNREFNNRQQQARVQTLAQTAQQQVTLIEQNLTNWTTFFRNLYQGNYRSTYGSDGVDDIANHVVPPASVDPNLAAGGARIVSFQVAPLALWLLSRWASVIDSHRHEDFHRNLERVGWWPQMNSRASDSTYCGSSQVLNSSGAMRTARSGPEVVTGKDQGRYFFAHRTWAFGLHLNDLGEKFKRFVYGGTTVGQYLGTAGGVSIPSLTAAERTNFEFDLIAWGELNRGTLPYPAPRANVGSVSERVRAMYRYVIGNEANDTNRANAGLRGPSSIGTITVVPHAIMMEPWW